MRDFIGTALLVSTMPTFLHSIIYAILGDERWWLRFAFGMIMLGLWYAGSKDE